MQTLFTVKGIISNKFSESKYVNFSGDDIVTYYDAYEKTYIYLKNGFEIITKNSVGTELKKYLASTGTKAVKLGD